MGNSTPQKPKPTLQDALIQMKINSKRMNRESQKAMKDSQAYMKKAKQALKKNNQQGAKLYLQSAASKRAQSMSLQRMGMKMQFIGANMKSMNSNQKVMATFQQMAQIANQNNPNFELMSNNLSNFQKCMDDILINGKMMEELMAQNTNTDTTAENMMEVLKGQLAMDAANQVNEAALIQQKEMEFQENLKKL